MWFTSPRWGNRVYLAGESAALNVLTERIELFASKHKLSLSPFFLNWKSSWAWPRLPSWVGTTEESTHYSRITSISTWSLKWHLFLLQSLITVVFLHADLNKHSALLTALPLFHQWTHEDSADCVSSHSVRCVDRGYGECVFCHSIPWSLWVLTQLFFHLPFSSVSSLKKKKPDSARHLQNQVVTFT